MATVARQSPQRLRAEIGFKAAVTHLQETIPKDICMRLGEVKFPDLREVDGVYNKVGELEAVLENFMESRAQLWQGRSRRRKAEDVILGWARASYPFANVFLTVAKEGSSVC
jgi:hypothetical protein